MFLFADKETRNRNSDIKALSLAYLGQSHVIFESIVCCIVRRIHMHRSNVSRATANMCIVRVRI